MLGLASHHLAAATGVLPSFSLEPLPVRINQAVFNADPRPLLALGQHPVSPLLPRTGLVLPEHERLCGDIISFHVSHCSCLYFLAIKRRYEASSPPRAANPGSFLLGEELYL